MGTDAGEAMARQRGTWGFLVMLAALHPSTWAAQAQVLVTDTEGTPLPGAVVSLHGEGLAAARATQPAVMDQRDGQFSPRVLVVEQGADVAFPNSDNIRHHVYSFSPAKRFELPLYSGQPSMPVRFDNSGLVVLGCNIHDWMIGYILVLDTPVHARTDAQGRAVLQGPAGSWRVQAWHEGMPAGAQPVSAQVTLSEAAPIDLALALAQALPAEPAPAEDAADARLRELQERFRRVRPARREGDEYE